MYNLTTHYDYVWHLAHTIIADPRLVYLHPFGSTQPENIEFMSNNQATGWARDLRRSSPLLICHDQEPLDAGYNRNLLNHINQNYAGIKILLHSERNSVELDKILNEHGYKSCYYFFHAFAAADWYRGYQYQSQLVPVKQRTLKKKYISLNRITSNHRIYRALLVSELVEHNLLNDGYVSFSRVCPDNHQHYRENLMSGYTDFKIPVSIVHRATANLDKLEDDLRIDFVQGSIPNQSMVLGPVDAMMSSFVHVVSETQFWPRKQHLTEKIFKPVVARQPFILAGSAHNLEYLKSYGFKTFDRWWDESYDSIEDPVLRLQAIRKLLQEICNYSLDELTAMLADMESVLEHNYNHFYSKEFLDYCWKELTTNLNAVA
jgi:hypothetical protein